MKNAMAADVFSAARTVEAHRSGCSNASRPRPAVLSPPVSANGTFLCDVNCHDLQRRRLEMA